MIQEELFLIYVTGYKPTKITHSSDNFEQLYKWAIQLIEEGKAYVCHQTAEEVKGIDAPLSPWRDRPIAESRQLFQVGYLVSRMFVHVHVDFGQRRKHCLNPLIIEFIFC